MACSPSSGGVVARFDARLGRCPRCMRLALLGTVVFLGLGAALLLAAAPRPVPALLPGGLGFVFLSLWIAHLLRFAWDAVERQRRIKVLRKLPWAAKAARRRFWRGLGEGIGWSLPRRGFLDTLSLIQAKPDCDCYFGDECWLFPLARHCDYTQQCTFIRKGTGDCPTSDRNPSGSCDGVCVWGGNPSATPAELSAAVSAVFTVFAQAARAPQTTGRPARPELEDALARVPTDCRDFVYGWVFSALDVVMGWDLVRSATAETGTTVRHADFFLAHVADAEATPALIETARDALVDALGHGDESRLVGPFEGFWKRFPAYHPAHSGRCYPHGHGRYDTALECHLAEFAILVRSALGAPARPA